MARKKKRHVHIYTSREEKFLQDCVLPPHSDKEGMKAIAAAFNEKFGTSQTPTALYAKAAFLQGRWKSAGLKQLKKPVAGRGDPQPVQAEESEKDYLVRINGKVVWQGKGTPEVEVFGKL